MRTRKKALDSLARESGTIDTSLHSPVAKGESILMTLPMTKESVEPTSTAKTIRRNDINEDELEHMPIELWMAGYPDLAPKKEKKRL